MRILNRSSGFALLALSSAAPSGGQEAKLIAPNAQPGDRFGEAVGFHADTAVVGSPQDNLGTLWAAGSASVYVRQASSWSRQKKLMASDGALGDAFGSSVSITGETVVVGAPYHNQSTGKDAGAAYVFLRNGTAWTEQAKLTASDAMPNDQFGGSVGISGDTIVVGALWDAHSGVSEAGSAYVFVRSGTTWTEQAKLVSPAPVSREYLAYSAAIDADTIVLGSPELFGAGALGPGHARVFARSGTTWSHQSLLYASDGSLHDEFGFSVSVSGSTVAVGARRDDPDVGALGSGVNAEGSAYVFLIAGTSWIEQAKLTASDAAPRQDFGNSVSILGDRLAIGAPSTFGWTLDETGAAYLFTRSSGNWNEQQKFTSNDLEYGDEFGRAVALSTTAAIFGAPDDTHAAGVPGSNGQGSAYLFRLSSPPAEPYCTAGISGSGCVASLHAAGEASASASSGFVLTATGVEGAKGGLFFFGSAGRQANTWGNGTSFQCVVPPVRRGGLLAGAGTAGQCDGSFAQDLNARWCPNCPKWKHNPVPGTWMQAQLWYRDPLSSSNQATGFSNAIEFWVAP